MKKDEKEKLNTLMRNMQRWVSNCFPCWNNYDSTVKSIFMKYFPDDIE